MLCVELPARGDARLARATSSLRKTALVRVDNWQNACYYPSIPGEDIELDTSTSLFSGTMHSAEDGHGSGSSRRGKLLMVFHYFELRTRYQVVPVDYRSTSPHCRRCYCTAVICDTW